MVACSSVVVQYVAPRFCLHILLFPLGAIWFTKYNVNDNSNDLHSSTIDNKFEYVDISF
jgi:hypothetical protein